MSDPPRPYGSSANTTRGAAMGTQRHPLQEGEERHWGGPWEHLNQGSADVAIVSLITAQACSQTASVPEVPHLFLSCLVA